MREEIIALHQKPSRFSNQNQAPNHENIKANGNNPSKLRAASSWGSQIVKGFDKKTKKQSLNTTTQKNPPSVQSQSRAKRSLIGDLSCSSQVHPNPSQRRQPSSGSHDLLVELDHLRCLIRESKEREVKLQSELSELKWNPRVLELENEVEAKRDEIDELKRKVNLLECETAEEGLNRSDEIEVVELRRLNKELQMQKRDLACRLSYVESRLATTAKTPESDNLAKIKAEASILRHTNQDLCKQVEVLQMSRLNEVEELAYLRWVNSCLRNELRSYGSGISLGSDSSPNSAKTLSIKSNESGDYSSSARKISLIKKLKKWPLTDEELSSLDCPVSSLDNNWGCLDEVSSPRRHSICGIKTNGEEMMMNKRRQSDGFIFPKEMEKGGTELLIAERSQFYGSCQETNKLAIVPFEVEKRTLRIPNPPPRPSCSASCESKKESLVPTLAPPPPPPPPPRMPQSKPPGKVTPGKVKRAPQVVEFYHSLMKRDSRKETSSGGVCDAANVANVRNSMIGEIENRSSYLLAIKEDVEMQGEFVNALIREVNDAVYQNIEDVVAFVKWLDDELCFLVDERAVLKHFDWPEKKADTLREAAFGYKDLQKLESEVCYYKDDPRMPCDAALKKIIALSEKMERSVYNLLRTRESLMRNCKEFEIPIDWMLDSGIISKIKFGSVKLAQKYMKRVALELQLKATPDKDPAMDYMLLQGVRFAFRNHQFAGGFDSETMQAFEELRNLARPPTTQQDTRDDAM